jgi:Mce-associated membrane protein
MWPRTCAIVLAALALLAGGAASAAQPDNVAFVDTALTQSVIDQTGAMLTAVLSYDYRELDQNAQLAKDKGTEQYLKQHTELINKTRQNATKQKQVVETKVVGVGVRELRPQSAKLLVFLDQTTTRGDTNKASTAGFAATVDLKLVERLWKLDSFATVGT